MSTYEPIVGVIPVAYADTINAALTAIMGFTNRIQITSPHCPAATPFGPVTHYVFADLSSAATPELAEMLRSLGRGYLPSPLEGEWGADGLPTDADAREALAELSIRSQIGPAGGQMTLIETTLAEFGIVAQQVDL
jgi:hypothetical protein